MEKGSWEAMIVTLKIALEQKAKKPSLDNAEKKYQRTLFKFWLMDLIEYHSLQVFVKTT